DVVGMTTRNGGHLAQASQRLAMADPARNRFPAAARARQLLAPGDAAFRHISDEARAWIAVDHDLFVFRDFDDTVAQRLAAAVGVNKPLVALADVGLRHDVGLDHPDPWARLDRSEVVS